MTRKPCVLIKKALTEDAFLIKEPGIKAFSSTIHGKELTKIKNK